MVMVAEWRAAPETSQQATSSPAETGAAGKDVGEVAPFVCLAPARDPGRGPRLSATSRAPALCSVRGLGAGVVAVSSRGSAPIEPDRVAADSTICARSVVFVSRFPTERIRCCGAEPMLLVKLSSSNAP
jgi:hypothetical protein